MLHLFFEEHTFEGAQGFRSVGLLAGLRQEESLEETVADFTGFMVGAFEGLHHIGESQLLQFIRVGTPVEPVAHHGQVLLPAVQVVNGLQNLLVGRQFVDA